MFTVIWILYLLAVRPIIWAIFYTKTVHVHLNDFGGYCLLGHVNLISKHVRYYAIMFRHTLSAHLTFTGLLKTNWNVCQLKSIFYVNMQSPGKFELCCWRWNMISYGGSQPCVCWQLTCLAELWNIFSRDNVIIWYRNFIFTCSRYISRFIYQELSEEAWALGEEREGFIVECHAEFVSNSAINSLYFLKLYKTCLTLRVCFFFRI